MNRRNFLLVAGSGGVLIGAGGLAIADELYFLYEYHTALVGGTVAAILGLALVTIALLAPRREVE